MGSNISMLPLDENPLYHFLMKRILFLTLIFTFSCAHNKPAPKETLDLGPASVKAPTSWGKTVAPGTEDFLEEVENAPAQTY